MSEAEGSSHPESARLRAAIYSASAQSREFKPVDDFRDLLYKTYNGYIGDIQGNAIVAGGLSQSIRLEVYRLGQQLRFKESIPGWPSEQRDFDYSFDKYPGDQRYAPGAVDIYDLHNRTDIPLANVRWLPHQDRLKKQYR